MVTLKVFGTDPGQHSPPPDDVSVDETRVISIRTGDSSGKRGAPEYCVVTFDDETELNAAGTEVEVRRLLRR